MCRHARHSPPKQAIMLAMTEPPGSRSTRIVIRRFASSEEADRHDLEFWMQIPERERVLQVWRLSQELWRLRGELRDEPGLCRSVARVHRR
jgi:hypothetical protein